MSENASEIIQTKSAFRQQMHESRAQTTKNSAVKNRADGCIVAFVAAFVRALPNPHPRVAAYSPLPTEPGGSLLLDALASQAGQILLPITMPDGELHWAAYRGTTDLSTGPLGVHEPTGERFDSSVLATCDVIFTPAMAIDRSGNRLGKGRGYYDQALSHRSESSPVIALVYSDNIVEELPAEDHDEPVDAVITERGISEFSALATEPSEALRSLKGYEESL
ncbi:5-formyltetrahydrofolate cyclo-ligase [Corynebacterium breve]|uniref:5-formyltetrahydrofolate cyclo-ligase n=1 Tax=Corynebacterium breve TaxID=3049799 RepID=A0ABY8VII2_9CORY|nr:5-formyltetrahydrofolate cyclo-ligase [Corynebacterium breve]WIM68423.1 5-formyltetrahydrofolate cyclo-ligase [Corynebacterium breve]